MVEVKPVRFILRAEIRHASGTVVCYGFDLTPTSIFVVTDWQAPVDTVIALRLSFPGVLEAVEVYARVGAVQIGGGPGELGGVWLVFGGGVETDDAQVRLAALSHELDRWSTLPVDRTYRVLLVEDSGFTRDMFAYGVARFLRQPGALAVDHADTAERAWDLLGNATYDIVIVDYYLPATDGAALISRMRNEPRLARLPVVAISVGGSDARDATIAAGADLFLDKPLVFRDLFGTLGLLARQAGSAAARPERRSILVFDDSPLVLAVTSAALEAAGFKVAIAADLMSFEQQRRTFEPDLILVDVQMPEAFGDDIASTLRGWHGVRVPILLVSSLEETELAHRARRAEASGYIHKDAGMGELVRRCKELLGRAA